MSESRLVDALPLAANPIGKLALRVYDRAMGEGKEAIPIPPEVFTVLIQLLQILFSAGCFSTAVDATAYVNSQRIWRVRRIGREVRRLLRANHPIYTDGAREQIVRSILFECKFCTVPQMLGYMGTMRGFQDF